MSNHAIMGKIKVFIKEYYLLIGLIIASLPYRLYHITYPILDAHNFRQAQTATVALNFYKNGINLFQSELDIFGLGVKRYLTLEFPLYEATVAVFYRIFFFSEMWGRMVSIVAGCVGAWYLYKLVKLLTKKRSIAFFSSFFFLFAPLNMFYQRTFMIEPTVIAFLLAGVYYACSWINFNKRKDWILAVVFLALGFIQKGIYGPFWLLPIVSYFIGRNSVKSLLSFQFITLIFFPLIVLYFWQSHVNYINTANGHEYFTTISSGQLVWNFGTIADRLTWSMWQSRLYQILNGILLKPGLLLFLIGFIGFIKMKGSSFFYAWIFSQLIYFAAFFRIQSHNYYQMVMIPAFSVFMSAGLVKIMDVLKMIGRSKYIISNILLCIFCLIFVYKAWVNTLPSYYIDWDWYKRLLLVRETISSFNAGLLVTPGYDWNSVYTYIPGKKMLLVVPEEIDDKSLLKWKKLGYDFLLIHEPEKYDVYFREKGLNSSIKLLDKHKRLLSIEEFTIYLL